MFNLLCLSNLWIVYCLWTICLLFLNDIHNNSLTTSVLDRIVYGLYVYFFWMTYTTDPRVCRSWWPLFQLTNERKVIEYCLWTICLLFLNDIHNTICILSLPARIVYGLYVYFFWMTYTTAVRKANGTTTLFMDYMFTFFEWHTQRRGKR